MVDCIDGLTNLDKDFARVLRTSKKPLIIVANKADTKEKSLVSHEFYELGLDASIMSVSSISGSGTGELLDQVVAHFQQPGEILIQIGQPINAVFPESLSWAAPTWVNLPCSMCY